MINVFEGYGGISRYHKIHNIYGDYILAVRGNIESIENIRRKMSQDCLTYRDRLRTSVYNMSYWGNTPQNTKFWNEYYFRI